MKRRLFLGLVATSFSALAGADMGPQEWCLIELTYNGEPVTEPVRTVFRMNTKMKATFRSGNPFFCDGVTMRREGEADPFLQRQFEVIKFTPDFHIEVEWIIADNDEDFENLNSLQDKRFPILDET